MNRITSTMGIASLGAATALQAQQATEKPNIIMILADDLGWADTSLTGSKLYETPNIERLAERGMLFSSAYCASPLCSPTRASILTGMNPARTGFTAPVGHMGQVVLKPEASDKAAPFRRAPDCTSITRLDTGFYTLGMALKDAGYATGHFGKWHVGPEPYSPLEHGFDVDIPHWPGPGPAGSFVAPWRFPNFKPKTPTEHIEDRMGDEAVAFMKAHKDETFYLNYWQFSVHAPFDAKQEYIKEYKAKIDQTDPQRSPTYAAMVKSLDDNVGKIMDALDSLGISDKTIIIFYSDNGGNMYDRVDDTTPTSNAPLRGGKATIYEGGVRVPAIIALPGMVKPGSKTDALVQSEDLYPTILEMAGATAKDSQACDGISMFPVLRGEASAREAVYCYFPHSPAVPDWSPPSVSVRKGDWKLILFFHDAPDQSHRYELYNLADDIGEQHNLADAEPARVRELTGMLDRFLKETKAVTPLPNANYDAKARASIDGWRIGEGGYGVLTTSRQMKTMTVRAFDDDVMLTSEKPITFEGGLYTIRVRMESYTRSGSGYVEIGGKRTPIATIHDRHMHDYEVTLDVPAGAHHIHLSPCTAQGTTQVKSVSLIDAAGRDVQEWEFGGSGHKKQKPRKPVSAVAGWSAGSNGDLSLSEMAGSLHLESTGGDPMMMATVPGSRPAGDYRLVLRMQSNASGDGLLFVRSITGGYQAGTGNSFDVHHDGEWHDYTIAFTAKEPLYELRLDPCTGPGKVAIQSMQLQSEGGDVLHSWSFSR